jgi:hypothetical protein
VMSVKRTSGADSITVEVAATITRKPKIFMVRCRRCGC